jgi:ABC-type branched-subunit amino acid transport system ATPase component
MSEILFRAENISKTFGGLKAVDNVSFALRAGIVTTLVGPNGAGKTTLFNAMTGHLVPDHGSVTFLGKSILGLAHWKIARLGVGRTFQDLKLFSHMTVAENVTFGPRMRGVADAEARARAEKALGPKFDLKQFHEILRDGAMPLSILERRIRERMA